MHFQMVILGLVLCASGALHAQNLLTNGAQIHQRLRSTGALPARGATPNMSRLRIAIIDSGFDGFDRYGERLGPKVEIADLGGQSVPDYQFSKHGFAMAQLFMAASGALDLPESSRPQVFLVQANGYTEFKRAVEFCVGKGNTRKVDIILNSKNFEWGTDFKGGGFFNAVVARATRAGIVWINSVGNTGNAVYFSNRTRVIDGRIVALPGPSNTILFENRFDDQQYRIFLTWDDFTADSDYATQRDLDFNVLRVDVQNRHMVLLEGGRGNKRQIGRQIKPGETGVSGNAFEELSIGLSERGLYAIRVYDRSKNFKLNDKFQVRIVPTNPDALKLITKNEPHEINEVTAPADRQDVIAVGTNAPSSAVGTVGGMTKPDVIIDLGQNNFKIAYSDSFSNDLDTSSAAAIYAGIVANLMAVDRGFSARKLGGYLQAQPVGRRVWHWPLKSAE